MIIEVIKLKSFIDNLNDKINETDSRICVGLDPHLDLIPEFIIENAKRECDNSEEAISLAVLNFNKNIIDEVAKYTAIVKPQIAFYEKMGLNGLKTLDKTINYAKEKGLLVLLDAKRNDIGSTAKAYAEAYLKNKNIDAITINPYFGLDGVKPFLNYKNKGAFALVRTSNKSAGDVQDIESKNGKKIYEHVGELVKDWGKDYLGECGYSNLGAVIGATYPKELKKLRSLLPGVFLLIPGYGAQGGGAEDVVYGFDENKAGAIINSSRGIIFAYRNNQKYSEKDFAFAAGEAAKNMKEEVNNALDNYYK
ncbi:MAG: orotidine-5'-phosphate decarboxylase [Bacillota bacterium]